MNVVIDSAITAVLAALTAGVFWLLGWRLRRARLWLSPLGVSLGFAVLYWRVQGAPEFPPLDATHWAFWLALFALPLGWLADIGAAYRWVWVWGTLLGVLWLFVLPFYSLMGGFWSYTAGVAYILSFALGTWLLMTLTAPLGDEPGLAVPFLIATLGGVSAGLLFYDGKIASAAQLSGTLGAMMGFGMGFALFRGFTLGRGAVSLAMFLFMLFWTLALGFADLTPGTLALLYMLALTLALRLLPGLQRQPPIVRFAIPLLILVVIGGGAVWFAYSAYMAQGSSFSY